VAVDKAFAVGARAAKDRTTKAFCGSATTTRRGGGSGRSHHLFTPRYRNANTNATNTGDTNNHPLCILVSCGNSIGRRYPYAHTLCYFTVVDLPQWRGERSWSERLPCDVIGGYERHRLSSLRLFFVPSTPSALVSLWLSVRSSASVVYHPLLQVAHTVLL